MKRFAAYAVGLTALGGLTAPVFAAPVTHSITAFTNDPTNDYPGIGVSSAKVYTHTLDFVDDAKPDTVNGVAFTAAPTSGANYTITGAGSSFGGGSANLMDDFTYGNSSEIGHVETDTFTGLTAGTAYSLRFYTGPFGSRPQTVTFTNTAADTQTFTYDPGDNTQYLAFLYTAQSGSVSVSFASQTDNNTFHQYAITNEVVPEPASLSLLAIGGLALLTRRRRHVYRSSRQCRIEI